jgi:hypothetical protein
MKPVSPEDVVVGQYRARGRLPGYLDDATVPSGSLTPTFAAVAMFSALLLCLVDCFGALFDCLFLKNLHPHPTHPLRTHTNHHLTLYHTRPIPPPTKKQNSRQRALGRRAVFAQGRQGAAPALRRDPRAVPVGVEGVLIRGIVMGGVGLKGSDANSRDVCCVGVCDSSKLNHLNSPHRTPSPHTPNPATSPATYTALKPGPTSTPRPTSS